MPTPIKLKAPFFPGNYYHVICKSTDGILLFNDAEDFSVYIAKFRRFTRFFLDNWSYTLLNNHSHHIIKINPVELIRENLSHSKKSKRTLAAKYFFNEPGNNELFDRMIERQMNSFLVSYVNYYNNKYDRKGGLFQKPFRRKLISDDAHLQQAIIYVHANSQKHRIVKSFIHYKYSSFRQILSGDHSYVNGRAIINFFGGKLKFEQLHHEQAAYYYENT